MTWQLAIGIHLILSTIFSLRLRVFARDNNQIGNSVNAIMYLLVVLPFGALWAVSSGEFMFVSSYWIIVLLALGGFLFAVGNNFAYKANEEIDAAQFSITNNLRTVTTIFLSSILLGEALSLNQLAGVGLIVLAALMISIHKATRNTFKLTAGSLWAIAAAVFVGAAITNEKYLLGSMSLETYLIVGWGFQALAMGVIASKDLYRNHRLYFTRATLPRILELGLFRTLAGLMFIVALIKSDNSSLIAGVAAYKTALVVVAGYLFLKEGTRLAIKMVAAVVATAGLLMLIQ